MKGYLHTVVDGDLVGAFVGLEDGDTDGDTDGLLVGERVAFPALASCARLCVFFAILGVSLVALRSTLSFLALPNRRSFRFDNVEIRSYIYMGRCMLSRHILTS